MAEKRKNFLGKGRSASVYKITHAGKDAVRKIFTGSGAADLAMSIFFGTTVDYQWSEDAVKTAFYRRRVLNALLKLWFNDRLQIATPLDTGKDDETGHLYLDTDFVQGETARLYNPFSLAHISEYNDLKKIIFPELQQHLYQAGFVGAMWQAGYGQPCSIANFLCIKFDEDKTKEKWVWIDTESGVPALASYSIFKQLGFYFPWALKLRRPLFDDVDESKLRTYISENNDALKKQLGKIAFAEFLNDVDSLLKHQAKWKSMSRFTRIMHYYRARGRISEEYFSALKQRKRSKLGFLLKTYYPTQFGSFFSYFGRKSWSFIKLISPIRWGVFFLRSMLSRKYRVMKSCAFIEKRINEWEELKRITPHQAEILKTELHYQESSQYLADFGIFLALKPFGYFVKIFIVPLLLFYGWINPIAAVFIIIFFSVTVRFIYALLRGIEDFFFGRPFPYVAILIAPIPSFGTCAHPCQMVHSARKGHEVSQFIVYEVLSTIAKKIPVWGGYNSEIEYFLNRIAYKMIKVSE